jgi:hypothetical protein
MGNRSNPLFPKDATSGMLSVNDIIPIPSEHAQEILVEQNDQRGWCRVLGARSYFVIGGLDEDCIKVPYEMVCSVSRAALSCRGPYEQREPG